ncbi:sugar kinase [Novosphingobium sp. 17-62-19]|uniref:sugar kinase n=1 Tax=Novosphingobium sp. 17-62-19 TaxID=1970406 RepID=UPI002601434D|nr:sugar kinase [Novosphingobium sp. 17-62-19]HQS96093.1 sugar kinase [Novosphingobium sp.]
MLELSRSGAGCQLAYGGDTLNTAVHMARAGHDVAYLTALGSDPLSADLKERWAGEGLDTSLVLDHPTRSTGLYAISTDATGERSFSYWRDTSAAREMFALPGSAEALELATQADLIAFSLITLAILPPEGRKTMFALAGAVRLRGGQVAFDGNYRQRLWNDTAEACKVRDEAIALATIGLPTLEDETALSGEDRASAVASHWQGLGCAETVVKLGAEGCRLPDGSVIAPEVVLAPVDTSGAGDAFNAGYLAARLDGADHSKAACAGHKLAGWTIMRSGAIPAQEP